MISEIDKNLWDFDSNQYYRVITTNGNIKKNGKAVMGKGLALQASIKYPQLPILLAEHIKSNGNIVEIFKEYKIITFPTKNNWREDSNYELIRKSCRDLFNNCICYGIDCIVMPKVGCSNGGLEWDKVRKIIYEELDDDYIEIIISRI